MERQKFGVKKQFKLIVKYFAIFLLVPIIGTLAHEFGHWIVAVVNGYQARIAYAYCIIDYGDSYNSGVDFFFTLGGPVETWINCLVPFYAMVIYYNKEKRHSFTEKLPNMYLVLVIGSSFCLRFVFNAAGYAAFGSSGSDEYAIALDLGIRPDIIIYGFAIIGWTMIIFVFVMIPRNFKISLIIGGLSGAISGYILWYYFLGPIVLPV